MEEMRRQQTTIVSKLDVVAGKLSELNQSSKEMNISLNAIVVQQARTEERLQKGTEAFDRISRERRECEIRHKEAMDKIQADAEKHGVSKADVAVTVLKLVGVGGLGGGVGAFIQSLLR